MRSARPGAASAWLLLALIGCVSAGLTRSPYFLAERDQVAALGHRWVLAPVDALMTLPGSSLPDYLVEPADRLEAELCRRIEDAGHACSRLSLSGAEGMPFPPVPLPEAWEGIPDDRVPSWFTRDLAGVRELDAVVFPEVVTREVAVLQGGWVAFDGVKRRTRVVRGEAAPFGTYRMAGQTRALSLRIRVFARDGAKIFESYAGLDLLEEGRVDGTSYRMQIRPDLLGDPELLRESVELALDPLLAG